MANLLSLTVLVCATAHLTLVESLSCYNCAHLETTLPPEYQLSVPQDDSCQPGRTPSDRFKIDCQTLEYSTANQKRNNDTLSALSGLLRNGKSVYVDNRHENYPWQWSYSYSCINVTFDGKMRTNSTTDDFRGTIRTCLRNTRGVPFGPECHQGKLGRVTGQAKNEELTGVLSSYGFIFDTQATETKVCICSNSSYCNVGEWSFGDSNTGFRFGGSMVLFLVVGATYFVA